MKLPIFLISVLSIVIILPADAIDLSELGDDVGLKYKYIINYAGYDYELSITANFQVVSHTFSETNKSLKFNLETPRDTGNKLEVHIPNEIFTDEVMVLLDGQEVFPIINLTDNIICSEMTPQVQLLREIRDNIILQTKTGTSFMTGFNQFYYSFSPAIADYERENPTFKEMVKLTLTPLLISLTLLQHAEIDSESEMLGYGIGVILLNIGMYFVVPAVIIINIRKRVNIEKF